MSDDAGGAGRSAAGGGSAPGSDRSDSVDVGGFSATRGPLQGLADLAQLLDPEHPRTASFARGLVVGALVGAAIAGSAIWRRRRPGKGDGEGRSGS